MGDERTCEKSRKTTETSVSVGVNLDGSGKYNVTTGIGFFDHMLSLLGKHSLMDLNIKANGDLNVDAHHTVEDTGIVLGKCISEALGDRSKIKRYGSAYVPMDEALAFVSLDISGRPYLVLDYDSKNEKVGDMDTQLVEEFFRALAFNAGITLHIKVLYGKNDHHMIEGIFKAFARAFCEAITIDPRIIGVNSTKGCL